MLMTYLKALYHYLLISSPYLILGLTVSALVKSFLSDQWIKQQLGSKGWIAPIKATLIGIPLPLCSCSVIPTAITFRQAGASKASTSAFLIATPESGVDSIAMTYAMMDFPMTIIRPIAALASGLVAAALQFFAKEDEVEPTTDINHCCPSKKTSTKNKPFALKFKEGLNYAYHDLINDIALWLLIGLLMGAAIECFVPKEFFLQVNNHQGRLVILLVGIPLYICASATTPIAAALVAKGMSPGSALLLLLVGPATNVSNFIVLQKALGKKSMILNIVAVAIVGLFFSYFTDYLYETMNWQLTFKISDQHNHNTNVPLSTYLCAFWVSVLIIKGIIQENIIPLFTGGHEH